MNKGESNYSKLLSEALKENRKLKETYSDLELERILQDNGITDLNLS